MRSIRQYLVAVALALAGCGGSPAAHDSAPVFCVPNAVVACHRIGGTDCAQVCEPDGSGYGGCVCDEVKTDAGVVDTAPVVDADVPDAEPPADALPTDTGLPQHDALQVDGDGTQCPTSCDDRDDCTLDFCLGGVCQHLALTNQPCAAGVGTCYSGVCCTGCWDGALCHLGSNPDACGQHGQACTNCGASTGCTRRICDAARTCQTQPQPDGTTCDADCQGYSSQCHGGRCRLVNGAGVCDDLFAKCLLQGTCDVSTTPHHCNGGCCDTLSCGF